MQSMSLGYKAACSLAETCAKSAYCWMVRWSP